MASSTVRQTVTTIQQSRSGGATSPILDNNLDALLEDLQTSVSRPSSAMNGMTSGSTGAQIYREVTTRTVQQEKSPANRDVQVQYLSAANPTTFVSERAASPGMVELLQQQQPTGDQRTMAYKTVSYQYNTSSNTSAPAPISGLVVDGTPVRSTSPAVDTASDARLQQNLNELDSLLVDLHHAQKTGFGTEQAGPVHTGAITTTTTRSITGVDPGLLEPIDHSTPTPPTRQQIQQITRTVQQRTYVDGGGSSPSPARYSTEAQSSPRLQPKRSSSANRELTYGTVETQHRTRSPSPSPRVPQRAVVQKDTYYETKNTTPKQERYRDKSPTNRRLQRELYYESKSSAVPPSPRQDRYRDPSPPAHRRGTSPMQYPSQPAPEVYPSQPGGSSKVTTIRTYNYSTSGAPAPSPVPPVSRSPYPSSGAPSPAPAVVELPHRSPSPYGTPQGTTTTTYDSPSGTKVTTTVRTYTYELPGQPGSNQPYPPNHDPSRPPVYDPNDFGPVDRTLTYQVSPPPPREKEPLLDHPQQTPPPTVITYKYSSHSSHSTSSKFPQHPEEQQPLLPRPFPTPSPTPVSSVDGQPPKRLDELMASFSDTEIQHHEPHPPPGGYYVTEKHPANARPQHPETVNGVAVPPANVQASASASASANANAAAAAKDRPKTKNVAGPPVYYPPGVELFAKKEESMMAGKKASGRYEYEYESKSKSKSSSSGGAAVVPVCLPLCCAMPCVIL